MIINLIWHCEIKNKDKNDNQVKVQKWSLKINETMKGHKKERKILSSFVSDVQFIKKFVSAKAEI